MGDSLKYFGASIATAILGVLLGGVIGYSYTGTLSGGLQSAFIVFVLSILEISLSFDNAVVNATVLKDMDEVWRHRFITWGIAIAVFGMRIVFPLAIVSLIAHIGPIDAVVLAATEPDEYSHIIETAHVSVSAFGGAFLAMVGLKHFIDLEKEVFWIAWLERPIAQLGRVEAVQIGLCLLLLWGVSTQLAQDERLTFLTMGIFGLLAFIAVDGISAVLDAASEAQGLAVRSGLAAFLYLEVLDASFSFDGVIGAFALSNNLFVIAIGLGTGAMFVRSLTVMLVEKGTLAEYRYLEHGAFYAIIALAVIMFLKTFVHVPEVITGLIGAGFIVVALWSSLRHNRREAQARDDERRS
ncbi:MAG: DUF475 domain-containing protein [Pseudomonadota bacterium]|nr:DUF475 domain-containing protein [Pseudomonadota bacterium]